VVSLMVKMKVLVLVFLVTCILSTVWGRDCDSPTAVEGESRVSGCVRITCKGGVWRPSLDHSVCCYDGATYTSDNTVITTTTAADGCTVAQLVCTEEAKTVVNIVSNCPRPATFQQVEEIKHILETHFGNAGQPEPGKDQTIQKDATTSPSLLSEEKGILITGANHSSLVELFLPSKGVFCQLPRTPRPLIHGPTINMVQGNPVLCQNSLVEYDSFECIEFKIPESRWAPYGNLVRKEDYQTKFRSWASPKGLMMIDTRTSQLVKETEKSKFAEFVKDFCAIPDGDSLILTGGSDWNAKDGKSRKSVTKHRIGESPEVLPYLNFARTAHGCGSYKVGFKKVLVVFGGRNDDGNVPVMTLEKFYYEPRALDFDFWLRVDKADMKRPIAVSASVSLGTRVFFIGIENYGTVDHLAAFNGETEEWEEEVAEFDSPRDLLTAATLVEDTTELKKFCN